MKKYFLLIIPILFFCYVIISPLLSEQIKVIKSSLERGENGKVYVKGVIYNNNSTSVDAMIEVTFFDKDHEQLGTTHVEIKDLPGRNEGPFMTDAKILPAAVSYVIKATGGFHNPYNN